MVRSDDDWTVPPTSDTRWILCLHSTLTLGKRYEVLEIDSDYYRVLDDRDDPVLFHYSCLARWTCPSRNFGCGTSIRKEIAARPGTFDAPGYFEDYHDGKQTIRDAF